jgi:hypothetical protein
VRRTPATSRRAPRRAKVSIRDAENAFSLYPQTSTNTIGGSGLDLI